MNCDWAAKKWLSCSGYVEGMALWSTARLFGNSPAPPCIVLSKTKLLVLPVLQLT